MTKLIILQGPPTSGKSTFAKQYKTYHPETVIVSLDKYREAREVYWLPKEENKITNLEKLETEIALTQGLDVIVDDTNLNQKYLRKWYDIAQKYKAQLEIKSFYVPFKEACQRALNPDRKHEISKHELKKFWRKYFPDKLDEESRQTIEHKRIEINKRMPKCILCDLDGTVAWMQNRSPYNYTEVSNDKADPRMVQLLEQFLKDGVHVIFLSGRTDDGNCRQHTHDWIVNHIKGSQKYKWFKKVDNFKLLMRKKGDYRPDETIKSELYVENIKDKYDVMCVFDDRNKVVNMWRELGMLCCQVNEGDF